MTRVNLNAWRLKGVALFRSVAEEVLDYVVCEMTCRPTHGAPCGSCSIHDADGEGEEGKILVTLRRMVSLRGAVAGARQPWHLQASWGTPDSGGLATLESSSHSL